MIELTKIDLNDWRDLPNDEDIRIPKGVVNKAAFLIREKMLRYIDTHPCRMYHYMVDDKENVIDCKMSVPAIKRKMLADGASPDDLERALHIRHQFSILYGKISQYTRRAFQLTGASQGSILDLRGDELLELFGKLHTIEEVHQIIQEEWGLSVSKKIVSVFYNKHLKEIERLRDQYAADYSDLSLSRKRARLDKLSIMFYTYFNKWHKDPQLSYSRELRSLLEQIKKEIEGEQININVQGQIDVDLTLEANRTLKEVWQRIPINNLILAMVAVKQNIDPTQLMAQLMQSYYARYAGFIKGDENRDEDEKQMSNPFLTYNWNEIKKSRNSKNVEDAHIVDSTGDLEEDQKLMNLRGQLLNLLREDMDIK